ncbi:MAG TPA: tRNA (guanosine(37)-N1)-methyltransferase TrmD [Candidatus Avilachnospira avistercoris]|nr:tRNA (guanosine(37)-N1)-methyltransferase TrmD [Candidatus Avilachnospira avistercoris]
MDFYVMTLFPEMIEAWTDGSIIGRAKKNGLISVNAVNIRDYTENKHQRVDDYPYGGGAGMVMQAQPVFDCWKAVCGMTGKRAERPRTIYLSPQGKQLTQEMALSLAKEEELILLCGHYEGIDERALELIGAEEVSIGDYVLTGGELPALVLIDCVARLIPGVLGGDESALIESFHDNLLEYPQYTRPEVYEGLSVPEILLSGHHANVEKWRRRQSIERTLLRRPDLIGEAVLSKKEQRFLWELKERLSKEEDEANENGECEAKACEGLEEEKQTEAEAKFQTEG